MKYVDLFGIWENEYGMSFKLTDKVKEAIAQAPADTFVNIKKNKYKQESKHPDYKASYKPSEEF